MIGKTILPSLVIALVFSLTRGYDIDDNDRNKEIMSRTLPAYAFAENANLLNGSGCEKDLIEFREAIDNRKLWSLRMLDSSGEPRPGFIYGNNYWLGIRSQCYDSTNKSPMILSERIKLNNSLFRNVKEEFPPFDVHYFVAYFTHNSTLQYHVTLPNENIITLGLCLPATCTMGEIGLILNKTFQERTLLIGDLYKADFKLVEIKDLTEDKLLMSARRIFILIVFSFMLLLMLMGTIYDVLVHQRYLKIGKKFVCFENNIANNNESKETSKCLESITMEKHCQSIWEKVLLCFSIYTNTKIIFTTKLNSDSIPIVHGLRFLGMAWIIMIHTIFYMSDYADNKPWSWRVSEGFTVQIISNSTLSVDTFFFLSGFLVAYLYLNEKRKKIDKQPINYSRKISEFFGAVLKRFLRLTPAYMMVVGIVEVNSAWYGEVSQFYMSERPQDVCAKYWWRNILYINNLFGRDKMCMSWSWYLSNDMQFFIIGTFLLILSSVCFCVASTLLILIMIGSIGITGYISYIYGYVPTMDAQYHMLDVLYDPPWTRIGPYVVGMITAYILIRLNNKLPLKTRTVVICWLLGSSCNIFVLFGIWKRYISIFSAAFYVGFSRTIWAVGLSWLLIACCTRHGGIVNKILSFRGWIPLSRLTYCAYLLNPFIINSIFLHSETSQHVDFISNCTTFLGVFGVTYLCSYVLTLMLETPNILLMRLLVKR
ncbi:nose resistant to fluoxetine protein 6-like [Leptopilina heterotoma]|uniref:nose resistant to fluoxetine protein 6-like n=1 Tax=Leptopilina heterotoma TaxID=63436 RepID=UPI001CA8B434|nr:nose resistant to fluoxetine protein 6-like [Leptopilina heterotoma]